MGKLSSCSCSKLESMHFYNKASNREKSFIWRTGAKKLVKITFWWNFNETFNPFRVKCLLQIGKLSSCSCFKIETRHFYSKVHNSVKTFILRPEALKLFKKSFRKILMKVSTRLELSVFYKWPNFQVAVYSKLESRYVFNNARNCVKTSILGLDAPKLSTLT